MSDIQIPQRYLCAGFCSAFFLILGNYCSDDPDLVFVFFNADQLYSDHPKAILGLFDLSQRTNELKDDLSLTMPYPLWRSLYKDLNISCLTTHAWKKIENRLR